jgi:hypothetical protein
MPQKAALAPATGGETTTVLCRCYLSKQASVVIEDRGKLRSQKAMPSASEKRKAKRQ